MPAMIRHNKKATKIAYDLIGTPSNMRTKKKKSLQERENIRLQYQDNRLQK